MTHLKCFITALLIATTATATAPLTAKADDGHNLWLRMEQKSAACVTGYTETPTAKIAADELKNYWQGKPIHLILDKSMADDEGFAVSLNDDSSLTIRARHDIGLLYGAYELLRRQQSGNGVNANIEEHPAFALRILNHWDNPDGSIERGYAGKSIFWGEEGLPHDDILTMYARANASIGINATVLNNVNASPMMLSDSILYKVKRIADRLRPYGIKVYIAVNFASPIQLGKLDTADPLDKRVAAWWKKKTDEVYALIPDFGGYLVKANSEGQPGPGDYKRTHAEGANMLADALAPHGGIVMWRSFVYGYHEGEDRVKKAVNEFQPLDGLFRPNVLLQSKNGPLDFQPREPYSPIFDSMKSTELMVEMQITQEYTGQSRHLVYLAPMWSEFFSFVDASSLKAMAGVANIGNDTNWCGHHFSQANWYAFGRMAWNPHLTPQTIADEWLRQTFSSDTCFLAAVTPMMMDSREYCVDYMMPLGLHHIFKGDHHYGPEPEGNQPHFPDEWKPVWYHKADKDGIGFNRSTSGTDAVSQYREPYRTIYNNPQTCPEEYLLWFHHLPWNYRMTDGTTLWQSLNRHYNHGVEMADSMLVTWRKMAPYVDKQRFDEVEQRLIHQQENAREWRDHCLNYFKSIKDATD